MMQCITSVSRVKAAVSTEAGATLKGGVVDVADGTERFFVNDVAAV
jgi:hypothetical protein